MPLGVGLMLCNWKGHLVRWLCGGVLYGVLEVLWRGHTHLSLIHI